MVKSKAELSQERAKRLKCLREMSGLTRDKIKARYNISRGTLQNWESARFGGLTSKGAAQIIKAMQAEGIIVSHDWLYLGIGESPSFVNKNTQRLQKQKNTYSMKPQAVQELLQFQTNNSDVIDLIAPDQSMWPYVHKNDLVAGLRRYQNDIKNLINKISIIQTHEHGTIIRKLLQGDMNDTYHLVSVNPDIHPKHNPMLYNVSVLSAAEVVWLRVSQREPIINYLSDKANASHIEIHE
ncbi:MAG: hypothetical protein VX835_03550 [Pseudomonadota bacterium]|nr:hypothetical protein [Pseudomonadota bacterium]